MTKTKSPAKTNGAVKPVEVNVAPGEVTPQMALQHIRTIMANAVLFAWKDGTKTGLTLNDQTQLQQCFELVKAALPQ